MKAKAEEISISVSGEAAKISSAKCNQQWRLINGENIKKGEA
jgi:hypothetical protein